MKSTWPIITVVGLALAGCAGAPVDEYRAGCTKIDGTSRYGSFTQYIKGAAQGVHIYVGAKLEGKVEITCNQEVQEVVVTNVVQ